MKDASVTSTEPEVVNQLTETSVSKNTSSPSKDPSSTSVHSPAAKDSGTVNELSNQLTDSCSVQKSDVPTHVSIPFYTEVDCVPVK